MATNYNVAHKEGKVARNIEHETAKFPSDIFLWSALGTLAAAAVLEFTGGRRFSNLIGQLAAPLLIMGLYNKIVKLEGHDGSDGIAL